MKNPTLYSLQALRGIAAIAVMLLHHQGFTGLSSDSVAGRLVAGGSWGVDLFFIISGFIAAYTIPRESSGIAAGVDYFVNRLVRIVPLYYIMTLSSFGADKDAWIASLKSLLFIPIGGMDDGSNSLGPIYGGATIGQGWTLNYEMYFYMIAALSFIFGARKWVASITFITLVILIPLFLFEIPEQYLRYGFTMDSAYLSMVTHPIIFEFIAGAALGLLYPLLSDRLNIFTLILSIFGVGIFIYNALTHTWPGHGVLGYGLTSFLLVLSVLQLERAGYVVKSRILLYLGGVSYSVYLLHMNIKNIFIKLFKHSGVDIGECGLLVLFFSISTTMLISHFSHKYVEIRFTTYLKNKWVVFKTMRASQV
ncbi:acyltransferase 3 [Enterobacter hormaechei]|uniref:acyltransferase family protein n=1 Tax=Enterobacter hormaechei TaxID=158836 RepID=UPI0007978629|nr:acyltransferase [Enterobacter hormaechei]SAE40921.1 acyltransferase 3 [Enterobacter hormaechei]